MTRELPPGFKHQPLLRCCVTCRLCSDVGPDEQNLECNQAYDISRPEIGCPSVDATDVCDKWQPDQSVSIGDRVMVRGFTGRHTEKVGVVFTVEPRKGTR